MKRLQQAHSAVRVAFDEHQAAYQNYVSLSHEPSEADIQAANGRFVRATEAYSAARDEEDAALSELAAQVGMDHLPTPEEIASDPEPLASEPNAAPPNALDGVPFVAFGNEELSQMPRADVGDHIQCPTCGGSHPLEAATNQKGEPTNTLMFYKCGENSYLGAVGGSAVVELCQAEEGGN